MSEKDGEGNLDRISDLPDSILLHILSFLPTKTSVSTMSLVSRRWRHLWEHLQVFYFTDNGYYGDIKRVKMFAFFVNAVLTLRRTRDILKMHLDCDPIKHSEFSVIDFVDSWVHAAIGPRLQELNLILDSSREIPGVVLPYGLFSCSNLVSLSLTGAIDLNLQHYSSSRIYFPSLKKLYLDVNFLDSIDTLLNGFPILETHDIIVHGVAAQFSLLRFRVPPSLKRLNYDAFHDDLSTYIDIDAPRLEYLRIVSTGTFDTAVGNLQSVVKADIDVSFSDDTKSIKPLLNLLRAISGTKYLALYSATSKLLLCVPIPDFPVFRCLLHLILELPNFNPKLLVMVLENCHVLQDLEIESDKKALPGQIWETESTTRIPNSLRLHLTSILISPYRGLGDEHTFVEYILRNALVLKTMIIKYKYSLGPQEKLGILKKVSNIPRGSDLCQVEFE